MNDCLLPPLNDCIELDEEQIKYFRTNGHTLIKNVLTKDEAAVYRDAIKKATFAFNTENRILAERDTYGKAFLQIMNLWELDEDVKQFTLAKRFAKIAADLLGVDNVRIYHDQALYKEPGGGITPWHQDQYYWPLNTNNTITMWMPLIDISEDMGMLTFASASHKDGSVGNLAISDESEILLKQHIKEKNYPIDFAKTMNAGDATFHYGWTLHTAPANKSENIIREVMTIIYYADGAVITEPQNQHQQNDLKRWLGDEAPGNLAASKLNPLVL